MKTLRELVEENHEAIVSELKAAEHSAYENTNCEYRVYIDTDGEVGVEEWLAGDSAYLQFRNRDYERFYIWTACQQHFDILWDWWFQSEGDAAAAFAEKFGVELDTNPTDEEGWEIIESLSDNMLRQARVSGIGEDAVENWMAEQEFEAIEEVLGDPKWFDAKEIIEDFLSYQ